MKMVRWLVSILMVMLVALTVTMAAFAVQSNANSIPSQSSSASGSNTAQSNNNQLENTSGGESNTSGNTSREVASGTVTSSPENSFMEQSDVISLPSVSVGDEVAGILSNGIDVTPSNTTQTLLGIVFWVCIAIGILIIVVVIIAATRKPPKGGTGKKRYERRPMTPKGKRILNEKYYRNIKK